MVKLAKGHIIGEHSSFMLFHGFFNRNNLVIIRKYFNLFKLDDLGICENQKQR